MAVETHGFHQCKVQWLPGVDSHRAGIHPESTSQAAVFELLFTVQGWTPRGVDSQKFEPVASDVPRFARQHTNIARKEPEISWLAGWTPVGPLPDPGNHPEIHPHPPKSKGENEPFGALSPSCLRNSTNLLQMSKEKVLQHIGVTAHSSAQRSWSAPTASAARPSCGRNPAHR